jgi:ribosomal protein L34E
LTARPRVAASNTVPRTRPTLAELLARVEALEDRVARLEAGRAPPGDGRAAKVKREREVKRCPGCGLPLRRRAGRCAECGRPLDSL